MDGRPIEEYELVDRLKWFTKIRYYAALGIVISAILVRYFAYISFNIQAVINIAFVIAIYNLALTIGIIATGRAKDVSTQNKITRLLAYAQSFADVIALTAVLYFTGTVENPFMYFYIFQLIFVSILLSPRASIVQAAFSIALFTSLTLSEYYGWIPHNHLKGFLPVELYKNPRYVAGNLIALTSTIIFSTIIFHSIITHLRQRELQIINLTQELEHRILESQTSYEKLQLLTIEKARYVRKISHEIKSPLSAIQTTALTLLDGYAGEVPKTQKKLLNSIIQRAKAMSNLILDMLALSKVNESLPHKVPEQIDVREITLSQIKDFETAIAHKKLKIVKNIHKTPLMWAFKDEVEELIQNLIENAVKYTPEEGSITCVLEFNDKAVKLTISDSGIGIEQNEIPLLFDEFYRSKKAKKYDEEGTGLGLSIVKSIVEKHRGTIDVSSEPGKGTTFSVNIPIETGFEK